MSRKRKIRKISLGDEVKFPKKIQTGISNAIGKRKVTFVLEEEINEEEFKTFFKGMFKEGKEPSFDIVRKKRGQTITILSADLTNGFDAETIKWYYTIIRAFYSVKSMASY